MANQQPSWNERQRKHWGLLLRTQRELIGLSQEALADEVDVRQSAVSMWESGASAPSPLHRRRVADVLRISPEALFPHLPLDPSEVKR